MLDEIAVEHSCNQKLCRNLQTLKYIGTVPSSRSSGTVLPSVYVYPSVFGTSWGKSCAMHKTGQQRHVSNQAADSTSNRMLPELRLGRVAGWSKHHCQSKAGRRECLSGSTLVPKTQLLIAEILTCSRYVSLYRPGQRRSQRLDLPRSKCFCKAYGKETRLKWRPLHKCRRTCTW